MLSFSQWSAPYLKSALKHLLDKVHVAVLDVIRDCKDLPWRWCLLRAILGNHLVNFLFQLSEEKCFTQMQNVSQDHYIGLLCRKATYVSLAKLFHPMFVY